MPIRIIEEQVIEAQVRDSRPTVVTAPRIACYSHDTVGLGHTRRNIAVAAAMIGSWPAADAMLLTGNPEATSLWLPPRTDVVTLPTVAKDSAGRYRSRTLNASLDSVLQMRSAVIEAAMTSFAPDLLIVDKVPLGVAGELLSTLRRLRSEFDTTIVLGLREILDDPATAAAEWVRSGATTAIEQFFDAIWIYGDRRVYDPISEYGLPARVAERCVFTGYLAADRFADGRETPAPISATDRIGTTGRPYVLCTVGGGQDGGELAQAFARAPLPSGHDGIVVCGPFMAPDDRAAVHAGARGNPQLSVLDFVPDLHRLVANAAAVVSMAGYNSVCEVLAGDCPALLVPRTRPRAEQLVRAQRLAELGAADMLTPDRLSPTALADWLATATAYDPDAATATRAARATLDLDGLRRVPVIARRLLDQPRRPGRSGVDHRAA